MFGYYGQECQLMNYVSKDSKCNVLSNALLDYLFSIVKLFGRSDFFDTYAQS